MKNLYSLASYVSLFCAALFIGMLIAGMTTETSYPVIIGLLALSLGIRQFPQYASLSFTILILASVSIALYYPATLVKWGDYELKNLITPLMQLIMFGVGSVMTAEDFVGVAKMPKAVGVGLAAQFTIMPLVGYTLAKVFGFPPEIAAGVVLIGCVPSGLASNVMCYIANANVALSVTITSLATIFSPILTPSLLKLLAGEFVEINFLDRMLDILKVAILPIVIGVLLNRFARTLVDKLKNILPLLSMGGIVLIVGIITAMGRDKLLTIGLVLLFSSFLHNLFGYLLGYWAARVAKLDEKSCRAVAIEVGLQNGGLASALALQMGKVSTMGLAPAIFGPLMNTTGSILANWWRNRPVSDTTPEQE
ncbi:MAG: bile acid:sodium symporter family protein [Spirosomataceae bacterium]